MARDLNPRHGVISGLSLLLALVIAPSSPVYLTPRKTNTPNYNSTGSRYAKTLNNEFMTALPCFVDKKNHFFTFTFSHIILSHGEKSLF